MSKRLHLHSSRPATTLKQALVEYHKKHGRQFVGGEWKEKNRRGKVWLSPKVLNVQGERVITRACRTEPCIPWQERAQHMPTGPVARDGPVEEMVRAGTWK